MHTVRVLDINQLLAAIESIEAEEKQKKVFKRWFEIKQRLTSKKSKKLGE